MIRSQTDSYMGESASNEGLVLHAGREDVHSVMIGGRWALRDGWILAFDQEAALAEACAARAHLRAAMGRTITARHRALTWRARPPRR